MALAKDIDERSGSRAAASASSTVDHGSDGARERFLSGGGNGSAGNKGDSGASKSPVKSINLGTAGGEGGTGSRRTAASAIASTGKSTYESFAEAELYFRQTGRQSEAFLDMQKNDPDFETNMGNYKAERNKQFDLIDGKWQRANETGDQSQLAGLDQSITFQNWDITNNGFDGFDFTTIEDSWGNQYTLSRRALDRIRSRYAASMEGAYDADNDDQIRKEMGQLPRSYDLKYTRYHGDPMLKQLGLPYTAQGTFDAYAEEALAWDKSFDTVQDFASIGDFQQFTSDAFKRGWENLYTADPYDLALKAKNQMPMSVDAKYRDKFGFFKSAQDEYNYEHDLPPVSELDGAILSFNTHVDKQNRIQQFYGSVAASWFNIGLEYGNNDADVAYESEDGTSVTVGQLREQAFVAALDSDEFADVREMYQERAKSSEVDAADFVNDPLGLWEAQRNAENKQATAAEKLLGTDYVSYDAFVAAYPAMRTQLGTQNVVDEAILAAKGDGYTYADLESDLQQQRDAEMFAGIGTKQAALAYVDRRASDDPLQILQDMFDGGVDFKHIRQAKNYLADQHSGADGKETRDAIFALFGDLREKNKERTNAQIDASAEADRSVGGNFLRTFLMTAGGMGAYDPEAYQAQTGKLLDVIGEDKARKDRTAANVTWLNQNVVTPYLMGETSSMSKVEAAELYRSLIELDDDGKATSDSSSRARDALIDAGASGYMALEVVAEYASESGGWQGYVSDALRSANRNPGAIEIGASPFNASMQAAKFALHQSGEDDMRKLIAQTRERVVSEGIMTSFELDQAVRQAGWGSVLDAKESAKNYFVSLDYSRSVESTGTDIEKAAWQSVTPAEQQEIAAAVWNTYSDDVQTSYTGWFSENAMANPDVAKTNEEVLRYQGIGSVATKAVGGIFTGAVNLVDMGASIFSGRSERWKFTEEVTDFTNYITNYGRSNQSYLTEGISLASDVGAELARMYALNAAGSALGAAAGAAKAGAATTAVANSATAGRGMRFLANAGLYAVRSQPFILTATGNYYAEAMEAGATAQQATWYAIICGGLEGGLEQLNVDQWVAKGLGSRKAAETLLSGGSNAMRASFATKAKLISLASSFCGEFTEESLSYTASYWMQRATYNKGAEFSIDELLESGFMGGLVGLFGSAISLGSYSNSSVASEYAARYGINSANLDLAAVASRVDSWSAEKRAQESMGAKLLPLNEYASTAFDLAQADAAIRAANSRYGTFVSESQAAIDAAGKSLTSIGKQITAARRSGDIDKLGKLMRQYTETKAVLQRAVSDFSAQDPTNRLARDTSIDQNTRTMAKANARLDSHDIAIYNLFQEDISAMREKMDADGSASAEIPNYVAAGSDVDAQYADDATIDPDAIDDASSRLVDSDSIIRNGLRRVSQADAVLARTLEKMRAARGGNISEFLEAQMQNDIMDANSAAKAPAEAAQAQPDTQKAADANAPITDATAPAADADVKPAPAVTRVALSDTEKSSVVSAAAKLGRTVEFRDDMEPWENGYYENGKMVLNSNQRVSADGNALKATVYRVLTHEMTHSIEGTDEYARFADFVCRRATLGGASLETLYQGIIDDYAAQSNGKVQLDLAGARKELVSMYAETYLLTDQSKIDAIVLEQRGFAGRVLNWIQYQIAKSNARKSANSEADLALVKAERMYLKAFAAAGISPTENIRQNSVVRDSQYDYRVIADGGISSDMSSEEALEIAKTEVAKLRGNGFKSLIDGEEISVAQKNQTANKLYRPGLHMKSTKYANRLAVASQMGEAITASAPMPGTDAGAIDETHSSFKATSRANRSVIVEIPEFDADGKLSGARTFNVQLTVLGNDGGKIAYDISRINEMKDAHSDLLRLKEQGVDIDRASIKRIVTENADVVNGENNRQHSVSGVTWDDYFGGTPAGNAMRDAQYSSAVQKGDMEAAQRMVDEQANKRFSKSKAPRDANGKLIKFFTGTDSGTYTVPDPLMSDDGISLFATSAREAAESYTHNPGGNALYERQGVYAEYLDMRDPLVIENDPGSSWHDMTRGKEEYADFRIHAYSDGAYRIEIETPESDGLQDIDFSDSDDMFKWLEENYDRLVSADAAAAIEIMEGGDRQEDDPFAEPDYYEGLDENGNYTGELAPESVHLEYRIDNRDGNRIYLGGVSENVESADSLDSDKPDQPTAASNTRNYARWAFVHGYDSVLFNNIVDTAGFVDTLEEQVRGAKAFSASIDRGGDTVAVVFSPNQIKSADPVTYGDDGKVIPLSQRFDESRSDIRYSIGADGGTDSSDPFADLVARYGKHEAGMNPRARDINVPKQISDDEYIGLTVRSMLESAHVKDDMLPTLQQKVMDGDLGIYARQTNPQTRDYAHDWITRHGSGSVLTAAQQYGVAVETGVKTRDAANMVAVGQQLFVEASARGDVEAMASVGASLCILNAELGQGVQANVMLKSLGSVGQAFYMQRMIDRMNNEYADQIANGKMQKITVDPALMNGLVNAKTDSEIRIAENAITQHIGAQIPLTTKEAIRNWRYFSMLANPVTHIRNITGNVAMLGLRTAKDAIAAGIERAAVGAGVMDKSQRTHSVYAKGNQADRLSVAHSMFDKYESDITGGGKFGFEDELRQYSKQSHIGIVDKAMKANNKLLNDIEDVKLFMRPAFENAFTQYMVAQNIDPANMTAEQEAAAADWAISEAQRATFRDPSTLAATLNRISESGWLAHILVEGTVPFKKTPVNVAKRGVEYSPIGLVQGIVDVGRSVKDGKITSSTAIDRISSGLVGSSLYVLGAFLAKAGILRGKEKDDARGKFIADNGGQSYSLNFGDVSVGISQIAPAVMPLFMGAELYSRVLADGEKLEVSDIVDIASSISDPLMEMSFMSSLNEALNTDRSGEDTPLGNIGNVLTASMRSYASQFLPTVGGKVASLTDDTVRTSKADATSPLGSGIDYWVRSQVKKIPGASRLLEPDVNLEGKRTYTTIADGFGAWALDFANKFVLPTSVRVKDRNPVDNEIIRIYEQTGEMSIFPTDPDKKLTIDGKPIKLNAKQYTQFCEERGRAVYAAYKALISSPAYKQANYDIKAEMLGKAKTNAEGTVRDLWKEKLS